MPDYKKNKTFRLEDEPLPFEEVDFHRPVSRHLQENVSFLQHAFGLPTNADLVIRTFCLGETAACCVYIEGMADRFTVSDLVLRPLMAHPDWEDCPIGSHVERILQHCLPASDAQIFPDMNTIITFILEGITAVFVDGCDSCVVVETRGFEKRSVSTPVTEEVILGSQEAFSENLRTNITLIRKLIRSAKLISEIVTVGNEAPTTCVLLYMRDIVNPDIITEARRRLNEMDKPFVNGIGELIQLFEDHPFSLWSQYALTERPDRAASFLQEGQVVLICDGTPYALGAPSTFFHQFHTSEDSFARWPLGTMMRLIRALGVLLCLYLPGLYLALAYYYHGLLPPELLQTIAETHSSVPFSMLVEVLIMEISFELIHEAGTRVPGVIGPAMSIIGTLILGQASVAANLISPILIIIVALTGLGSFCMPNYSMNLTIRLMRFFMITAAMLAGFYGLAIATLVLLMLAAGTTSLGVPFLSPVAPHQKSNPDLLIRYPSWRQGFRPNFLQPRPKKEKKR